MKRILALSMFLLAGRLSLAQMTPDQRLTDFQQLAGLFSKRYAFTEWKKQAINFDSLNVAPWVTRINNSKDDLDFFEVCMQYVAANQDSHTAFELPTNFEASLGFSADLYDGKPLIDQIDRTVLDPAVFPVQVGDELVSVDGKAASDIAASYVPFINDANPRTGRRLAALLVTDRLQAFIPRAHQIGGNAVVVVRRQSGGLETYTLPWNKSGYPYTVVGPSPDPESSISRARASAQPAWQQLLESLRDYRARRARFDIFRAGELKPIFTLPDTFVQRLGNSQFDDFYTGTFTAGGLTIGYLRYPAFDFFSTSALQKEVAYFQSRTDGLIIDVMGNPGGGVCTAEEFLTYFNPNGFQTTGWSIRATWDYVMAFQDAVDSAILDGSFTDAEIALLQTQADAIRVAYSKNRGFTDPMPLCSFSLNVSGATDRVGRTLAYTKPMMVLADELTASAGEMFTSVMQDEGRALIYGMRTDGAGGVVNQFNVGVYMEAAASMAQAKAIRKNQIKSPEFPTVPYVENIGVLPDKVSDYMTTGNLLQQGKPFVADFTQAMIGYINARK